MAKLIFYDTETTGTNYMKHSIIQLSGIIELDGQVVDTFNYGIKPHPKARIEDAALKANGHTREQIDRFPPMDKVLRILETRLSKYVNKFDKKDKYFLVGYNNLGFDDNFFRMLFTLCGNNFFGSWFWADSIDVRSLAADYLMDVRPEMMSFKLHRVAKTLGIEVDDSRLHDGVYDAELTREIYYLIRQPKSML